MKIRLRHCGHALHVLAEVVAGCALMAGVLVGALAWRLSEGPLQLPWLTHRLEKEVAARSQDIRLSIGHTALAWEGFKRGIDQPLDIRLTDVRMTDQQGQPLITLPSAAVSLSPAALLIGHVVPRAIEIDGAHLRLLRNAEGAVMLDLGSFAQPGPVAAEVAAPDRQDRPLADLLGELAHPPRGDRALRRGDIFSQLQRVAIRDADLVVVDQVMHATWSAPQTDILLQRLAGGGLDGTATAQLALGDRRATVALQAGMDEQGAITLHGTAGPVAAATLVRSIPALARLAGLQTSVNLTLDAALSRSFVAGAWSAAAQLGPGDMPVAKGRVAWRGAQITAAGRGEVPASARIDTVLEAPGQPPHLVATAAISRTGARWHIAADASIDRIDFADLASLWPDGTDHGARAWLVENIPAGVVQDAHFAATVEAEGASNPNLVALSGSARGSKLQVYWLRPLPPITDGSGTLRLDGPDVLSVVDLSGHTGALQLSGGTVRISGLQARDQTARIDGGIAGPVADAMTLLKNPRLHLFDHSGLDLNNPSGTADAHLTVTLPLDDTVTIDQVGISAQVVLHDASLPGLVAGRDLDDGEVTLQVDNNGLTVQGHAALAGIPATLSAGIDFRGGPPSGVVQQAQATMRASDRQLAAAGVDTEGVLEGNADLQATWRQRRNGSGDVTVQAGLRDAVLHVEPLGWQKPSGTPATLRGVLRLDHGRLAGIDGIEVDGSDLSVSGQVELPAGQPGSIVLDHAVVGRSTMQGRVLLPGGKGTPWQVTLSGPQIDLSPRLSHASTGTEPARGKPEPAGPPWTLDARFDRALLAKGRPVAAVSAQAASDGRVITRAHLQAGQPTLLTADITSGPDGRQVHLRSPDAGEVLRDLDIADDIQGGALDAQARYDGAATATKLRGTATIDNFRVQDAPAMARLLQAMTLYGLVEVVRGPGLGFTKLVAPFTLTDQVLELYDARAYSESLGLTAKGRVDLARQRLDMQGTIIPAYFFNSLLGRVPLLGRLFSPEQGGGVFAATYQVSGPISDPSVSVNPLAALTPGFLRGLFGNL